MDVESMSPDALHTAVRNVRDLEADVRDAARRGEPMPAWVEAADPMLRDLLKLHYHHERAYCVPRMRGVAPF